jgi:hypothetical protein
LKKLLCTTKTIHKFLNQQKSIILKKTRQKNLNFILQFCFQFFFLTLSSLIIGFSGLPCFYLGNCFFLKSKDKATRIISWISMFLCFLSIVIPMNVITLTIAGHSVSFLMRLGHDNSNFEFQMVVIGDWVMNLV